MLDEKSLQDLKKEAEEAFKKIGKQREDVVKQMRTLQTHLNQIDAEIARLQGEYRMLDKIFKKEGIESKVIKKETKHIEEVKKAK